MPTSKCAVRTAPGGPLVTAATEPATRDVETRRSPQLSSPVEYFQGNQAFGLEEGPAGDATRRFAKVHLRPQKVELRASHYVSARR